MKRILYLLFLLSLPFVAFAQYPNAPNKIVLGRQTTGDGLIFRTNGQPLWTPANAANAWMALDTLTGNIWIYRNNEWFLQVAGDLKLDYPLVINKSSVNILQGQVVMVDTVQLVQGDRVRVRPAIATMSNSQYIMGVASEDIPNDSTGYITWFGYVREVDHADIAQTGVTLDVGDILYISATEAGKYTDTEPAAPNVNATIALVVRKPNANNMTLLVRPWLNEKLGDLSDVDLSGITNGQSIAWDSINRKFIPATFGTGSGSGTVTSIATNNGITGGTITTTGTIGLTGQALALHNLSTNGLIARTGAGTVAGRTIAAGTGISVTNGDGVSGNPTITNSAPDQTVVLTAGTGISTSGTYPNFTITNSAPDQTVSITGAGINAVTGTYPNFTITGTEVDGSITNEGTLGVGAGGANTAVVTSNTSGANGVTLSGGVGVGISETTSANGGTITARVDTAVIATVSAVRDTATTLRSLLGSSNLKGNGLAGRVTYWSALDTLTFDSSFTYNATQDILGLPSLGRYQIGSTTIARLQSNNSLFYGTGGDSVSGAFNNLGVGIGALLNLTSGDNNTASGYQSMVFATSGFDNTAYGYQSLYDCTTCAYNTSIGHRSLYNNVNGQGNVAVGYEALYTADSTGQSVAVGSYSLYYAKATRNTGVGHEALGFTETGGNNSTLGYRSLYRNTSGFQNVAAGVDAGSIWQTGFNSGFNTNSTNSVFIGVNSRAGAASQNNEIVIGATAIGSGSNTATIGNDSIEKTYLKGQLYLPKYGDNIYTGTVSRYLAVDTTGKVIEATVTAGGGLKGSGLANKVGVWVASDSIIFDTNLHWDFANDRLGIGTATPGFPLTVNGRIGIASTQMLYLPGGNFTGTMYVGDGGGSLSYSTGDNGRFNTATGIGAANGITTGAQNTANGYRALYNLTNGNENTALGNEALGTFSGTNNTAVGSYALTGTGNNNNNTAVGTSSLRPLISGGANTALGNNAGRYITNGSDATTITNSLFIGHDTRPNGNSQTNQIVIGHTARGNGSNTTTIGNASTTATHLRGQLKLEEYGDTLYTGTAVKYLAVTDAGNVIEVDAPAGGGGGGVGGSGLANKVAYWTNDSTLTYNNQFHFNPSLERLGVGTTAPAEKIEALGNIRASLGKVLVNTTGSQVIHVSNYYAGDSGGQNIWIGNGGNNDLGNDESIGNTAVGVDAMLNYGSGSSNAAFGWGALKGSTTWGGFRTTAIGSSSQELTGSTQDNTSLGYHSLRGTSGNANTALGSFALAGQNTGDYNIALGFRAGVATTGTDTTLNTSRNSIFIGGFTKADDESSVNEIVIGHQATGDGSNTTVIGNDSITSTKLKGQLKLPQYATNNYIGTAVKLLAVDASGNVIEVDTTGSSSSGIGGTVAANKVAFGAPTGDTLTSNTNLHWDNTNGRLGIGTNSPLTKLHIYENNTSTVATELLRLENPSTNATNNGVSLGIYQDSFMFGRIRSYYTATNNWTFNLGAADRDDITISSATGNVGIGTTSPGTPLDVKATPANGIAYRLRGRGADGIGLIQFTDSLASTQHATIGTVAANTLAFATASTEQMRITATGNVGIGVTNPSVRLQVAGDFDLTSNNALPRFMKVTTETNAANSGTPLTVSAGSSATGSTNRPGGNLTLRTGESTGWGGAKINFVVSKGNISGTTSAGFQEAGGFLEGGQFYVGSSHIGGLSRLSVSGRISRGAPVTVTGATHTLADATSWLIVNNAGTCTITLPTASSWTGSELTIKTITANAVVSASSNVVPIDGNAAGTAILPATDGAWAKLISDGTNWIIMQKG